MMKSLKLTISLCIFLMHMLFSYGQSLGDHLTKIPAELLKQDLSVLRDSLQNLHPGLYRYKTKEEMNAIFDNLSRQLTRPMTETEYFSIISRLISNIEDGHTECFLPRDIIKDIMTGVKIFPIQLRFIGNRAYIPCNTKAFSAGTEIIAIDNRPVNEVRKQLFSLLSSDGHIRTGKYVKINDGHDPFSYLYYVVYGEQTEFRVTYKVASGQLKVATLQADYFKNLECPPAQTPVTKYLDLEYKPGGIAVMTIKTFANELMEKTNESFEPFLAKCFKELRDKKISKLIIDLRENGGGEDTNGLLLYRYLTDKPFRYYASLNSTTKVVKDHPNLSVQQPMDNNFKGKVEFLISGKSFSGAAEFSSVAKTNARGIFIGEETSGGYYGNTSGSKIALVLPNSKIRVNIPLVKYVMAVKKAKYHDRGIIPDHTVIPSVDDYINHRDIQMGLAIKLLN